MRSELIDTNGTLAFLPFFSELRVFVFVVLIIPLYILVLFLVVVPDSGGVSVNAKCVPETDTSGLLLLLLLLLLGGRMMTGSRGGSVGLIGAGAG